MKKLDHNYYMELSRGKPEKIAKNLFESGSHKKFND